MASDLQPDPQSPESSGKIEQRRGSRLGMRVRRATAALAITGVLLYALSTPLLRAVGNQLVHSDPAERVDVMLVLAASLDRILEAANVYSAGYAPLVVLTRERREPAEQFLIDRGIVESGEEHRRDIMAALGVPRDAVVILDGFAGSTADEARGFAEWARGHNIHSVLIVTSPEHTGRARLTFLRALQAQQVKVLMRPSAMVRFRSDDWWRSRDTLRNGFAELQKLVYYRLIELPRLAPVPPQAPALP